MIILPILPPLLQLINRIAGEKAAINFLNLVTKERKFFFIDKIYNFTQKAPVTRLTVLLPGKGCEWAIKTGGCTMCAFWRRAQEIGKYFSGNDLYALLQIAINLTKTNQPFIVSIYNGGSFLNEKEIPFGTQLKICEEISNHFSIEEIFIESRVEFINKERIKILKNRLGRKKLIIGIGLEAQDDKIRNVFIKKGLNKKDYENSVKLLKENEIKVLTYVFLKPVYVGEREAIKEAIKTIEYAFKIGTDEVALESGFVQEGTLIAKLFKEKKYKPPWLWSIIEVIKRTYNIGPVHIGGFRDEPPPIAIPQNCPSCSSRIEYLLQKYKETHDIGLFNNLECDCYEIWKKEVKKFKL
jgi:radical SAM enzyme (TIGR01210 family)